MYFDNFLCMLVHITYEHILYVKVCMFFVHLFVS